MSNWIDPQPLDIPGALRDAVGGHPLVAMALARRGISTPAAARAFLDPSYYTPAPAADLPDADRAAERIRRALAAGEHVAIWGDFDVDGQTATALLVEALRVLSPAGEIRYHVPTRGQGHGLHLPTLEQWLDQGVMLLITCDTGIDALVPIERAAARGCDVIVTDHHDLPATLPVAAYAIVNPKRLPAGHPLHELSGVGVAYKLVEHLLVQAGRPLEGKDDWLDLVALGLVADVATSVADVRYLIQRGLAALRAARRVGLRALIEQAEMRPDGLSEEHIGYQLAPRLNALGRLGDANQGVELLMTPDVSRARILAAEADGLNYQRRLITGQILQAALTQIERDPSLLDYRALVLAGQGWHPGVVGVVAGRLAERFQRPAILLSLSDDGLARGSARSVAGYDVNAALERTAGLLRRFGGHPGAAGLTLDAANLDAFRKAMSRAAEAVWDASAAVTGLQIDAYVALDELSLALVSELERLAPFGHGNRPVQLATRDLSILEDSIVGRDGEHRRLVIADEQGAQQTVLWWQGADQALPEGRFDLAYALRARDYRGEPQLQVEWVDARLHGPAVVSPPRPSRTLVDWRREADPRAALAAALPGLKARGALLIWAEGLERREVVPGEHATDRLSLTPVESLVIWTAPPGPAELASALQAAVPATIYLVAVEPAAGQLHPFLDRLRGMVKHDLHVRAGQVNVRRLAAALGHREATVRAGLAWLAGKGQVSIVASDRDTFTLRMGEGRPAPDLPDLEARLRWLLAETAAYRRHLRSAPLEALGTE
jgi:single-stranded-DNA-specific exonuclease